MTITKEGFFKPGKMSSQDKAYATDQAARQIVASEAAQRARKTERLRQLRKAQEAEAPLLSPMRRRKSSRSSGA